MPKLLFQTSNSLQQYIAISLFFTMIILANISYVHAEQECSLSVEVPIAGLSCWFKTDAERLVSESSKKYLNKEAELHFGKMIDYMAQSLVKTAKFKPEFKAMLKSLFNQKIIFLLKDIDKVLNSITSSKSIEAIIENELTQVDQVILNALRQYNQANDPNQKTKLNKYLHIQLDSLRQKFRQEISHFLDESKYFSKRVNCTVEATLATISQNRQLRKKRDFPAKNAPFSLEISSITTGPAIPIASVTGDVVIESKEIESNKDEDTTHFESITEPIFCYKQLGLKAPPETWEYSTVYDLKKCKILNTLTPQTPTKRILNVYVDLKAWAAKMACIQHGAGHHATQHYIWDWLEFGYLYNLWYTR